MPTHANPKSPESFASDNYAKQEDELALDVQDYDPADKKEPVMSESDVTIKEPMESDTGSVKTRYQTPALIKFGLPVLMVIIFSAGLVAYLMLSIDSDDSTPALDDNSFEIGGAPIEPGAHAPATGAPAIFTTDEQLSGIESDIDALRLLIAPLQQSNAELQNRVNTLTDALAERDSQMSNLHTILLDVANNTVPSLMAADKQHDAALDDVRARTNKNKRRIEQVTKRKAESPPFTLLSIDEWGATTSAVLEIGNKTSVASVGDVWAGWRIVKIVRPDCIYVARVAGGQSIKICGTGIL